MHERLTLNGEPGYLTGNILHYTYRNFSEYFEKMNTYTTFEARYMLEISNGKRGESIFRNLADPSTRRPFLRRIWWKYIPLKPICRFLLVFIFRKGFLDGRHGLILAVLSGVSDFISVQKYRMLEKERRRELDSDAEFVESGGRS